MEWFTSLYGRQPLQLMEWLATRLRGWEEAEAELFQLFLVNRRGGVREGVDTRLRLRERDHLADVLLASCLLYTSPSPRDS